MKKWLKYILFGLGILVLVLFIGLLFVTRGQASELVNNPMEERRVMDKTPADLPEALKQVVEYRKSGLSLNHIVGCPLDCGYCVRHLFLNYEMKKPHLVMDDENAVDLLINHWAFRPNKTPIQIFNRATDPFLPGVKDHLFSTLENIDRRGFSNTTLVITRWRVSEDDVKRLEQLRHVKLVILVTWSGISDNRLEPVDSAIASESLKVLQAHANRTKTIFYWRPIIAGLNDTDEHLKQAKINSSYADATVFTGLFYRSEIRDHLRKAGLPDLYDGIARRKILPRILEQRVLAEFVDRPFFRKTSCGVSYVLSIPDYNGHYGIREICDICPKTQLKLCSVAHRQPDVGRVHELAELSGLRNPQISIDERRILVIDSTEQQRYFIQHALNFQVHDRDHPHLPQRHGRAEIGWT